MASQKIDKKGQSLRVLLIVLLGLAFVLAGHNRFVQDDAFISFRYAQNFANGNGLVWNVGERVEGYTNFLWTVLIAPAFLLNVDPVSYSYVLSLCAFLCTLVLGYSIASKMWKSHRAGCIVVFLLGMNFSFSSYATGGLETQFGIALMLCSIWLIDKSIGAESLSWNIAAGVLSACSIMTRMDSVLILAPFTLLLLFEIRAKGDKRDIIRLLVYGFSASIPLIIWIAFRRFYYGDWVPNTFYIKTQSSSLLRGGYYQLLFYTVYGLFIPVIACLVRFKPLFAACYKRTMALCMLIALGLWSVYLLKVGGDFMEFRLMMPAYAVLVLLISGLWCNAKVGNRTKVLVLLVLSLLSLLHGLVQYPYPCIQTIDELEKFECEWRDVATALDQIFGEEKGSVKIGVTCAGVIPYYSGMPALDLLGLNHREIAKAGDLIKPANSWVGNRPGHVRMATWSTVVAERVNILINTPWIVDSSVEDLSKIYRSDVLRFWYWDHGFDENIVSAAMVRYPFNELDKGPLPDVIAWPMSNNRYLVTVYVCRNPVVDSAIKRCGAVVIADGS